MTASARSTALPTLVLALAPLGASARLAGELASAPPSAGVPAPALGTLGAWLDPPFGAGSVGGAYTYDEVVGVLEQVHAAYPEIVAAPISLGQSAEGRDVWMVKVSDAPQVDESEPEVRFDALHRADEPQGMQTALWFLLYLVEQYDVDPFAKYLVDTRELYFVPVVNPDGYAYNELVAPGGGGAWSKNRRDNGDGSFGVDLARNYPFQWGADDVGSSPDPAAPDYRGPSAASEPEVAAMVAFAQGRELRTAVSLGGPGDAWLSPWGHSDLLPPSAAHLAELASLATETTGALSGTLAALAGPENGAPIDHDLGTHGTFAWSARVGSNDDGHWPPSPRMVELAQEQLTGLRRAALAAGTYVHVVDVDVGDAGDGDGYFEAGERVEFVLTVRNSGRSAGVAPAVVLLESPSLNVAVELPIHSFGSIPPLGEATNDFLPLSLRILPGTPEGTEIPYTLTLAYEGWIRELPRRLFVGEPTPFLQDVLEADLGWQLGVAGDDALAGAWELANPVGTLLAGEPASPDADHTPGTGGRCAVTGAGGGAADDADLDGGTTTLLSPPFDLSEANEPRVRYARWFASLGGGGDRLAVSISNDGGTTWVPVENVEENDNAWRVVETRVADLLPPTDAMRLRFEASDLGTASVVEAAVDDLQVLAFGGTPRVNVYGRPSLGGSVHLNVTGRAGDEVMLFTSRAVGSSLVDGVGGTLLLDRNQLSRIASGTIGPEGLLTVTRALPGATGLLGTTFFFQAIVRSGGSASFTNRDELTLE